MNKKNKTISRRCCNKRQKRFIPNRIIYSLLRSSAALYYFIGRYPLDISLAHSVSLSKVEFSTWKVIDITCMNQNLKLTTLVAMRNKNKLQPILVK